MGELLRDKGGECTLAFRSQPPGRIATDKGLGILQRMSQLVGQAERQVAGRLNLVRQARSEGQVFAGQDRAGDADH